MKRLIMMVLCRWLIPGSEVFSAGNSDLDLFVESIHALVGAEDTVVPDPRQHRVVVRR